MPNVGVAASWSGDNAWVSNVSIHFRPSIQDIKRLHSHGVVGGRGKASEQFVRGRLMCGGGRSWDEVSRWAWGRRRPVMSGPEMA